MITERPDPTAIMQLATGYWSSATLLAAIELQLFGALAESPAPADAVARRIGVDLRAVTLLLDACVGLDLLVKEEPAPLYRLSPCAAAFLTPGRPGYMGDAILWSADQYSVWGRLAETVRTGLPAAAPELHLGEDPEQTRRFVVGMHNRALGVARGLAPFLDFSGVRRLLDVGGGPGTYACLLAQNYPSLEVTVLDLPGIVAVARDLVREAGLSDRVQMLPGNAITDDYGSESWDGVLFSGVLHQMSTAVIRSMFARARVALRSGGRVIVSDMMLDPSKTRPLFSALFSLQMLLTSDAGAVFAAEECAAWLQEAGFTSVEVMPLPPPLPYTLVTGRT